MSLRPGPAIALHLDFLDAPGKLFDHLLSHVVWDERLRARRTASFGESYDYSGMSYPKVAMLETFEPLCVRIEAMLGFRPNNCLLNHYPDGQSSMGFHSDSVEELADGTGVAIVSLGAEREMVFRNKQDRSHDVRYRLLGGALLYMPKEIQFEWLHAIPKSTEAGARISLTFRRLVKAGTEHGGG